MPLTAPGSGSLWPSHPPLVPFIFTFTVSFSCLSSALLGTEYVHINNKKTFILIFILASHSHRSLYLIWKDWGLGPSAFSVENFIKVTPRRGQLQQLLSKSLCCLCYCFCPGSPLKKCSSQSPALWKRKSEPPKGLRQLIPGIPHKIQLNNKPSCRVRALDCVGQELCWSNPSDQSLDLACRSCQSCSHHPYFSLFLRFLLFLLFLILKYFLLEISYRFKYRELVTSKLAQ